MWKNLRDLDLGFSLRSRLTHDRIMPDLERADNTSRVSVTMLAALSERRCRYIRTML